MSSVARRPRKATRRRREGTVQHVALVAAAPAPPAVPPQKKRAFWERALAFVFAVPSDEQMCAEAASLAFGVVAAAPKIDAAPLPDDAK